MHPVAQILAGALVADFAAAFFHFWEDTYLPYTKKHGVFPAIARDNELHHALPYSMTTQPVTSNLKVTTPLSLIIAGLIVLLAPAFAARYSVFLVSMVVVGAMANVFHRWQHERECHRPKLVTLLQETGVLVGREQHKEHHDYPSRRYGVILGFTNYIYDGLGVWDFIRAVVPLRQYPKPGVKEYAHFVPQSIHQELQKECPRKLTPSEVDGVRNALRASNGIQNIVE